MTPKRIVIITDGSSKIRGLVPNGIKVGRAFARLGHDVHRIDHSGISREALAEADLILSFGTVIRANAILATNTITSRARVGLGGYFKRIAELKDKDAVSALWYFDMCNPGQKHSPYKYAAVRHAARDLDWLFTTDHSYPWERIARHYMFLTQGVEPADFAWDVRPPEPRHRDVIFTGGADKFFDYRQQLIEVLQNRFTVALYGRGHGHRIFGPEFFAAYQRARVALVPEPPAEARDHYWSNRIYLAAATGTPCVVGYVPGIEDYYEDGKEVVFYRTRQELVHAVAALVADPARRKELGDAARKRTLAEHTYDARCETMLGAIFGGEATH